MGHAHMTPEFGYAKVMEAINRSRQRNSPTFDGKFTFETCDGQLQTLTLRKTHLPYPGTCIAFGGDPRRGGRAAALTRCGHLTSSWLNVGDYEGLLAPLQLEYVEGASWDHHNHAWGRACDGPQGVPATGEWLEQLRNAWEALGQCFPRMVDEDAHVPLAASTRFTTPLRRGQWQADARTGNESWVERHGALAVAVAWGTFSARNVSEAGFSRHLRRLGLRFEGGRVTGTFPETLSRPQSSALHAAAWMGVFDAYFEAAK